MSRIGKSPIAIAKGVEIKFEKGIVTVKGPKGVLTLTLPNGFTVKQDAGELEVIRAEIPEATSAFHGLYRALIQNMVTGVTAGFEKRLTMVGVGYRANVVGHKLELQIGFSHPTKLDIPKGITVTVEKQSDMIIVGTDKQAVGQFAALVRSLRKPEPYKGKGIRYVDEYVRKKAGKSAAKTATK